MIFWVENLPQSISLALTGWVLFVIMMVKAYRYQNNENFKPDPTWIRGFGRMYVVALLTGIYLTLIAPVITSSNQSTEFLFKSVIFQIMGGPLVLFLIFYLAHRINPFWFIIRFMSLVLVLTGLVVLIDQFVLLPLQR